MPVIKSVSNSVPKYAHLIVGVFMSKDLIPEPTVFMHEFLGTWEVIHNPDFNCTEFGTIKNAAGSTMLLQGRLARLVALMCRCAFLKKVDSVITN